MADHATEDIPQAKVMHREVTADIEYAPYTTSSPRFVVRYWKLLIGAEILAFLIGGFYDYRSRQFPSGVPIADRDSFFAAMGYLFGFTIVAIYIIHLLGRWLRGRRWIVWDRTTIVAALATAIALLTLLFSFGVFPSAPVN